METKIGDSRRASALGLSGRGLLYYTECPNCQCPLWRRKSGIGLLCSKCAVQRQPQLVKEGVEAKKASELGYKISVKDYWLFKDVCPDCQAVLWRRKDGRGKTCVHCTQKSLERPFGVNHPRWVKGKRIRKDGYIEVVLNPSDPLASMAHYRNHVALEHRLVMARALGRPLKPWEIVHHRNRKRDDNRPENLELISAQHIHQSIGVEDQILQRLSQLEAKIADLSIQFSLQQILLDSRGNGNPELGSENAPECRDFIRGTLSG